MHAAARRSIQALGSIVIAVTLGPVGCALAHERSESSAVTPDAGRRTPDASSARVGIVDLVAGHAHTCVLHASGAVSCWGDNAAGQLGDGTTSARVGPVHVVGVHDAVQISAGYGHTCVRTVAGGVMCWGGTTGPLSTLVPTAVDSITDALEVSAGSEQTCVRRATGLIACWGRNMEGQLGDGTTTPRTTPRR